MRTLERFLAFCELPNPGFGCFDYYDRSETIKHYAPIKHLLHDGASPESLKKLKKMLDDPAAQVTRFFESVDGGFPFVDAQSGYRPFELCSIPDWPVATHAMRKWYLAKDAEYAEDIDFIVNGFAIGRINQTPDYITLVAKGPRAGQIHLVAHDDFRYEPIAESFNDFVDQMINDPVKFLTDIGAFAFYSDGETDIKWVPKEYYSDLRQAT